MKKLTPAETEKLHKSALLAVACNTIMLTICDDIKDTRIYRQQIKQLTNALTKELEKFVTTMHTGIDDEQEIQYYELTRLVEGVAGELAGMTPDQLQQTKRVIKAIRKGEVFEATTDKQMSNMIAQKRVKPLTTEFVHPSTGTIPFP